MLHELLPLGYYSSPASMIGVTAIAASLDLVSMHTMLSLLYQSMWGSCALHGSLVSFLLVEL